MADEVKPVVTPEVKVESKPADKPVADAGKPADVAKPAGDDKSKPVSDAKPDAEAKPSEELRSLLDEAGEEEVKLDKDGKPIEEAKKVVPEKYDFKIPEGLVLDPDKLAIAETAFKELGLDNAQAQKLVDLQAQIVQSSEEAHVKAWDEFVQTQKEESKKFFGTKLPDVMRNVARARDQFIDKSLQEKLNVAGFSNDKDFLVFMDKLGRVIGEGKFVDGKRSAPVKGKAGESMEQVQDEVSLDKVYPSMAKK